MTVSTDERTRLIATAGRLLRANLGPVDGGPCAEGLAVVRPTGRALPPLRHPRPPPHRG